MAGEKKSPKDSGGAEKQATRARQKAEHDVGILDNPDVPGEPSEIRHLLYFAAVVAIGIVLNLAVLMLVAGGS